ncbi:hypothetical protein [Psychroserpens sp. NJDZ02]|uniref:hypothetical protein n=1 Tax=Psychroserpens sp. NJDZ02 TaxID=2570561 RepID=UPI0010A76BC5|nr:hypothetical protein [Psychroserpens sp. NJDZ02]QCE43389.1 hypothetical protein E9099_18835 [Psychroserpens sp. NJDZ02]
MKRTFTLLLLLITLGYQTNAQNSINLEEINNAFVPKDYIKPSEDQKNILNKELNILFDKIFTKKNASKQDTLKYKKIEFELSKINTFKIDSLYHVIDEEKVWNDDNKKKWAVSYNMMSYSSVDSTAYFKDIYFPKVSFLENLNGEFIALSALTNYNKPVPKNLEKLYRQLTMKYGQPNKKKIRTLGRNKYSFEWVSDLLVYNLISDTDEYSFSETNYNFRLYIINKDYNDFVRGRNRVGDWVDLK